MTKQAITATVKKLIVEGKLKEVLNYLSKYVQGKDRYLENDLLLQTASFNRNSRDRHSGLISQEDFEIAIARLNYALTQILERLPEKGNNVKIKEIRKNNESNLEDSNTKILFLTANPKNTGQLRLGEELRKVKDSLAASTYRDLFKLVSESAVQIPTITKAMQQQHPHIIHFSGHGSGEDGIAVEDVNGNIILFPTVGLDRLFKRFKDKVKCVLLNACYSKEQAETISKYGIYVVGMNKAIHDKAAIDFAVGFYQSLGEGNDFEFAFDIAMVNNSANLADANTPELWLNGQKLDI